MNDLTADHFRPHLNQVFNIRLENGDLYSLELEEVRDLGDAPGPEFRKPFALTLRNPARNVYLPQGTYRLEHPQMGSLDLFIVPLGPDANGMRYEITFS